ncbi:flagellar assembly protein FliW [Helicobacter sp. MIT 14-3879]|uniref:flagellar assembly protein FliW n=1 Tax=Helicobacter sp. MIT 14-3879 TaxID=2040649 RepID=UPI000E1F7086|nr:flagellar assembly protein FliW [Helicobacter sp. MIT 14-3879]RDU65032.1 flagellar biosynthesis protein FliW [Helicobacter sp. MIT 14-3879]
MEFEVKSPILGFENITKMKLEKIDDIFMKLTNSSSSSPAFTLVNPFVLCEYSFEIPTAIQVLLDINEKSKNILIANIMVVYKEIKDSTINFIAPLVFNFDNHTMAQVVLDITKYPQYNIAEPISNFIKGNEL